ncbi:MAG: hypothetical protein INR64_14785, partial [Caulobacteraceae bacterium]|nr:hypothetical protein [Caulobacter sp.]
MREGVLIREVDGVTPELFASEIESGFAPVVMRGFASDWPAVAAARSGVEAVAD